MAFQSSSLLIAHVNQRPRQHKEEGTNSSEFRLLYNTIGGELYIISSVTGRTRSGEILRGSSYPAKGYFNQ
eukprot:scaffold179_cov229-Chaetoceros_neogracile.AAC.3